MQMEFIYLLIINRLDFYHLKKSNYYIIGSAHTQKEIFMKIKQDAR